MSTWVIILIIIHVVSCIVWWPSGLNARLMITRLRVRVPPVAGILNEEDFATFLGGDVKPSMNACISLRLPAGPC